MGVQISEIIPRKEISIKDEGYPLEKIWVRYQKNKTTSSLSQS